MVSSLRKEHRAVRMAVLRRSARNSEKRPEKKTEKVCSKDYFVKIASVDSNASIQAMHLNKRGILLHDIAP